MTKTHKFSPDEQRAYIRGLEDALKAVARRKEYYEMFRCNCGAGQINTGHKSGCKAECMQTRAATFATLDEIETKLLALLEAAKEAAK